MTVNIFVQLLITSSENKNHFAANLAKISQSSQQIYKLAKSHHWRKARGENKKIQNFIKDLETIAILDQASLFNDYTQITTVLRYLLC